MSAAESSPTPLDEARRQRRGGPRAAAPQLPPPPTIALPRQDEAWAAAREVDYRQLEPDPNQPRRTMDEGRLRELAASIKERGLLQPLLVRFAGLRPDDGAARYIVVVGGRRWRAIGIALTDASPEEYARLTRVHVILSDTPESERRVVQLVENIQREDLPPIEEARAIQDIMRIERLTSEGVAARLNMTETVVNDRLALLLVEAVEQAVERGVINRTVGVEIARLRHDEDRREFLSRAERGEPVLVKDVRGRKKERRAMLAPTGPSPALSVTGPLSRSSVTEHADNGPVIPASAQSGGARAEAGDIGREGIPGRRPDTSVVTPGKLHTGPTTAAAAGPDEAGGHPAATAAVANLLASTIFQHTPPEVRRRIQEQIADFAPGDLRVWWPTFCRRLIELYAPGVSVPAALPED